MIIWAFDRLAIWAVAAYLVADQLDHLADAIGGLR